jgi:hypothetical protein
MLCIVAHIAPIPNLKSKQVKDNQAELQLGFFVGKNPFWKV